MKEGILTEKVARPGFAACAGVNFSGGSMREQIRSDSAKTRRTDQPGGRRDEERTQQGRQGGRGAGPAPASGPSDLGADDLGPVVTGDAANVGFRDNPDTGGGAGAGASMRGNAGDAGADAGDGAIDATDATSVTGDDDVSPALAGRDDTLREGTGQDTGYRKGGASGALGPEDVDDDASVAPNPTGPAADGEPSSVSDEDFAGARGGNRSGAPGEASPKDMTSWKPGSDTASARMVGGEGDFGIPVGSGPNRARDYVSENTKRSDPGAAKPQSWEHDGVRTSGAGAEVDGEGSGSEGDVDPDIIGVGTGGSGIAASGDLGAPSAADDTDGTSNQFASGPPARGDKSGMAKNRTLQPGDVVSRDLDMQTGPDGQGSDTATNPAARGDDSFAAEVSSGEASGDDLSLSPSQETQGLSTEDNQGEKDE